MIADPENVPTVDKTDRLVSNLDTFMNVHRKELAAIAIALDLDVDLVLMDMMSAGFEDILTRAMQSNGEIYAKAIAVMREADE